MPEATVTQTWVYRTGTSSSAGTYQDGYSYTYAYTVPEPSTAAMLLLAGVGLGWKMWAGKRQKNA